MMWWLFVLLLGAPLCAQQIYDLLIRGGHVIDPASGRNERLDVAIAANRIVRVAAGLQAAHARVVVDAGDYYVTPGLIDIHVHFDAQGAPLNLNPDHNALRYGVTTAVDAGSSGWRNFEDFKAKVIDHAKVRLLAFLNIVGAGMYGAKVENDVAEMDPEAAARMVRKYPEIIVGIKTAHFQPATWEAVDRAVKAAQLTNTVVMVDFQPRPDRTYRDLLLEHMRPGDIHTHVYGEHIPQLDANRQVEPYMWEARKRGVLFDVGHGGGSFWFRVAAPAIRQGFLPDTISTDLHKGSVMMPRATLTNVMSKLLNCGMTIEQVVQGVTLNAAKAIRRPDLGALREGAEADVALLKLEEGRFALLDAGRAKLSASKLLRAALTVRAGKVVWDSDGLSAGDWENTLPYSNFK